MRSKNKKGINSLEFAIIHEIDEGKMVNIIGTLEGHGPKFEKEVSVVDSTLVGNVNVNNGTRLSKVTIRDDETDYAGIHLTNTKMKDHSMVHCHAPSKTDLAVRITNSKAEKGALYHGIVGDKVNLGAFGVIDLANATNVTVGCRGYLWQKDVSGITLNNGDMLIKFNDFEFAHTIAAGDNEILNKYNEKQLVLREKYHSNLHEENTCTFLETGADCHADDYACLEGEIGVGQNANITPHAVVINSKLGFGSNAQENTILVDTVFGDRVIGAHGATILNGNVGDNSLMMFNAYSDNASYGAHVVLGANSIHDFSGLNEKVELEGGRFYFGYATTKEEAIQNSVTFDEIKAMTGGQAFVEALVNRMNNSILKGNGADYIPGGEFGLAQKYNEFIKFECKDNIS